MSTNKKRVNAGSPPPPNGTPLALPKPKKARGPKASTSTAQTPAGSPPPSSPPAAATPRAVSPVLSPKGKERELEGGEEVEEELDLDQDGEDSELDYSDDEVSERSVRLVQALLKLTHPHVCSSVSTRKSLRCRSRICAFSWITSTLTRWIATSSTGGAVSQKQAYERYASASLDSNPKQSMLRRSHSH